MDMSPTQDTCVEKSADGNLRGVHALVVSSQALVGGDVALMTVSLSSIGHQLHAGPSLVQWVLSASLLTGGGFLILGGRLVDLLGIRRMFLAGAFLPMIGLLPGLLTNNMGIIIPGRALVGLGMAFLNPAAVGMIVKMFPLGTLRDRAFGLFTLGQSVGFFGGMMVGGIVVQIGGWHGAFAADFILTALNFALGLRYLPASQVTKSLHGLDVPGAIAATLGVGLLIYALSSVGTLGLGSPSVFGALAGAIVILIGFFVIERRAAQPLLSFGIFKEENISISMFLALLVNALSIVVLVCALLYIQRVGHFPPASVVLLFLPALAISLITTRLAPRALANFPSRSVTVFSLAAFGLVMVLVAGNSKAVTVPDIAFALALITVCGSSIGSVTATITIFAEATGSAPEDQRGIVSAVMLAICQLGAAVGVAISASTLAAHAPGASENFVLTYLFVAGEIVLGILLTLLFFRKHPPRGAVLGHH
jgi:MFS family permease